MKVTLREKKLKDGKISYYLDFYDNYSRKRKYEFIGIQSTKGNRREKKALAETIRKARETEYQHTNFNLIPDFKKRTSLIKYFEMKLDKKQKWSSYHSTLRHVKGFAKRDITFQEIDKEWLEKFKEYLLSKVSQNTAYNYFMNLKSIFKSAKKEKIIILNPAEEVDHIKQTDTQREFLSIEEIRKLAKTECKHPEVKRAFLFSCFTGLRFSDIYKLKWKNVQQDSLEIRQQKTKEILFVPLNTTSKKLLMLEGENIHYLPETLVFNLPQRWWSNKLLKMWFSDAKVNRNAHFHVSRHTFATLNITSGNDLYSVSKLLGHKNMKTTEIYSKVIDAKKKEAVDNLPEIEVNL